ncbi:methyltransferase type 12 [Parafrankia elaeagni]|uniref:methyltransferase type 12 n=1 Tax=Parafrankia elaeagni TaxID=222534 RepID=UPI000A02C3F6|nr:methyltransferase type 12 [Parafrankia elaeagni]
MDFDTTGKVCLDHIYTAPDPCEYYSTLGRLDYCIPQLAKPYFETLLDRYRHSTGTPSPMVLDIGCSYGVNAALLKLDLSLEELYEHYSTVTGAGGPRRNELLDRDRALARTRRVPTGPRVVGLDSSAPALSYAAAAGFLDGIVHADLEAHDPSPAQRTALSTAEIVISTGCVGYVTDQTITRIIDATDGRMPWMAHFVLRMFPFDAIGESLADRGYETVRLERLFRQRRFASPEEQSLVLDTLSDIGVDPTGTEDSGWLHAELFLSRPPVGASRHLADLGATATPFRVRSGSGAGSPRG